jgi:capsular exopolysaccharide synthesis family protein
MICSAIMFAGKNLKRIVVTSHEAGNGKTFVTLRIAASMANRGKKVLLIDGDLRKSVLLKRYRIAHTDKGLAHLLSGQCTIDEAIYQTNLPGLYLLPAGAIVKTPLSLLSSPDYDQLMDYAAKEFDLVLVDSPPIGIVIDAAEIAKRCDGSLLVLEYNKQTKGTLRYMQKLMEQTQVPVIGCIINKFTVKMLHKKYYYHYGGSYLHYGNYGDEKTKRSKTSSGHERRKK